VVTCATSSAFVPEFTVVIYRKVKVGVHMYSTLQAAFSPLLSLDRAEKVIQPSIRVRKVLESQFILDSDGIIYSCVQAVDPFLAI
jgi:hypothetical protein